MMYYVQVEEWARNINNLKKIFAFENRFTLSKFPNCCLHLQFTELLDRQIDNRDADES